MRAGAILNIPNQIGILELDRPTAGPDDVIVKPHRIGLCMTNVKMARHGYYAIDQRGLPFMEGHEVSGEVVEVGTRVKELAPGDRVAVYIYVPCHNCYYCQRGHPTMCDNFILGGIYPGGWAEYVVISRHQQFSRRLHRIAAAVSYDDAALLEPLSCVVHSLERSAVGAGDRVVVLGAGFMGLLHTTVLGLYPLALSISVDLSAFRLGRAAASGAHETVLNSDPEAVVERVQELTGGRGADVVFEVTGNVQAYELAPRLLAKGGTALFFGGVPSSEPIRVDPRALHYNMYRLVGCQSAEDHHVSTAMALINSGRLKPSEFITQRFPMERLSDAILFPQLPDNREQMIKVMLHGFDCELP